MNWIVKNEKPQPQPKKFEDGVADALTEAGIDTSEWTDEEIGGEDGNEAWRTISPIWEIRQAARMEWNRRNKSEQRQQYNTRIWTS